MYLTEASVMACIEFVSMTMSVSRPVWLTHAGIASDSGPWIEHSALTPGTALAPKSDRRLSA